MKEQIKELRVRIDVFNENKIETPFIIYSNKEWIKAFDEAMKKDFERHYE
jgi:hypothetical protein